MRARLLLALSALLLGVPGSPDPPRTFTIAAGGDLLIHRSIAAQADANVPGYGTHDFAPLLAPIEPWISPADLAICHLEVPLSSTNVGLSYYPGFNAPWELADAIAATGYDTCSTASNHALDMGRTGVEATLDILDRAGVGHTGTARTAAERRPNLITIERVTIGHLSYTYGTNGIPSPDPWSVNRIDVDRILADAAWARDHGADFVILSLHWGAEYSVRPTSAQVDLAKTLLASEDVDLILGHHVHVVQPIDRIGDEIVIYGMGNQLSNIRGSGGQRSGAEDGIIVHLEVTETDAGFRVTELTYTPTWVHPITKQVVPVLHAAATGAGPSHDLRASLERTIDRVTLLTEVALSPSPWPEVACRGRWATLVGTSGPDILTGTDGADVIVGRAGDDTIAGDGGNDLICGGRGNDTIRGGEGADLVQGGRGRDTLHGEGGDDHLDGGRLGDLLLGGPGDDLLEGGPGGDDLYGNFHDDLLVGGAGEDRLHGGPGADVLAGGVGDDDLWGDHHDDRLEGGPGDDGLRGGAGIDWLDGGDGEDRCRNGETTAHCVQVMR